MTLLEFEGKNVEKALDKASAKLNIPKGDLKYDILSYGSSGETQQDPFPAYCFCPA